MLYNQNNSVIKSNSELPLIHCYKGNKSLLDSICSSALRRQYGQLEEYFGWSVSKIIIILSFGVDTPKNKKLLIIKVTHASNHISLLRDSTILSALTFFCNIKQKDHIRRKINSKKKIFICEVCIITVLISRKLGLLEPIKENIKLHFPKRKKVENECMDQSRNIGQSIISCFSEKRLIIWQKHQFQASS